MIGLALLVGSIGLADSINPSTVAPALLLAAGGRAAPRVAAFACGVFGVSFAAGAVVVFGPGQLLLDALPHPGGHAKSLAELIGGAILLALAAVAWAGRRRVAEHIAGARGGAGGGARSAFLFGAGLMAVELPTAAPYFAAIAAILASHVSLAAQLVLLALFNLALVAPLLAVLGVRVLAGDGASTALEAWGRWVERHAAVLLAGLLALVGVACVAVGVLGLT